MNISRPDTHSSRQRDEELEQIRSRVLQMGGVVEEQLKNAVEALVSGDQVMARSVVLNDVRVNALEVEIDEESTRIMAQQQLAAADVRLVMAVIKTINDLERIGDEAKRVGKMVHEELRGTINEEIRQELEHMGELVRDMLSSVLDAFARTDVPAAMEVSQSDMRVDLKYQVITSQLMTHMAANASEIPVFMKLLWAARALERVGDRCQNIAEYVIYLVLGKDVRHISMADVRVELDIH